MNRVENLSTFSVGFSDTNTGSFVPGRDVEIEPLVCSPLQK